MTPVVSRGTVLAIALGLVPVAVHSEPRYQTRNESEDLTITLHTGPCQLKVVTNLKYRAVWKQKGELIEGCWMPTSYQVAMFYFADKTMAVVPLRWFDRLTGAGMRRITQGVAV